MSVNVTFGELQRGRSHIGICSVWRVVRVARERRGPLRESAYFSDADRAQRVDICNVLRKKHCLGTENARGLIFFDIRALQVVACR